MLAAMAWRSQIITDPNEVLHIIDNMSDSDQLSDDDNSKSEWPVMSLHPAWIHVSDSDDGVPGLKSMLHRRLKGNNKRVHSVCNGVGSIQTKTVMSQSTFTSLLYLSRNFHFSWLTKYNF